MGFDFLFIKGHRNFTPATDIPSLKGKVLLVTGANSGLGRQSVLDLARHEPACVWVCARGLERAQAAIDDVVAAVPAAASALRALDLDLCSFASVKAAARRVLAESDRLDLLMLNAGIMMTPPGLTAEGHEIQFGTNHVGHALLTKLLRPLLLRTADAAPSAADVRVVVLSSIGHAWHPAGGIDFDQLRTPTCGVSTVARYGQSKLANILFAREMARRFPRITTVTVHPGPVVSNLTASLKSNNLLYRGFLTLYDSIVALSVETGAKSQLWAATAANVVSGEYYMPIGHTGGAQAMALDDNLAARLWDWTERELEGQTI